MGNWFCDPDSIKKRGTIFGFWTCHQYLGDITAALCTAWVLHSGLPSWWALLIPAIANFGWAFITLQLISDHYDIGIITPEVHTRQANMETKRQEMEEQGQAMMEDDRSQPISYVAASAVPMVVHYAVAFGFFKLINDSLFFWLPYFLGQAFDPFAANLIASLYSVGVMPGGIMLGYMSDLFGARRVIVRGTFMCILVVVLAIFAAFSENGLGPIALLVMLCIMGILVGGYVYKVSNVETEYFPFEFFHPMVYNIIVFLLFNV